MMQFTISDAFPICYQLESIVGARIAATRGIWAISISLATVVRPHECCITLRWDSYWAQPNGSREANGNGSFEFTFTRLPIELNPDRPIEEPNLEEWKWRVRDRTRKKEAGRAVELLLLLSLGHWPWPGLVASAFPPAIERIAPKEPKSSHWWNWSEKWKRRVDAATDQALCKMPSSSSAPRFGPKIESLDPPSPIVVIPFAFFRFPYRPIGLHPVQWDRLH